MESGFDISELTEFAQQMVYMAKQQFPEETKKFMKTEARKLRLKMSKRARGEVKRKTGNYPKGFKAGRKVYEYDGDDYNILVYNSAPHAHLLEHGHILTTHGTEEKPLGRGGGKEIGFVPGNKVLAVESERFKPEFESDIENDLGDFIVRELER